MITFEESLTHNQSSSPINDNPNQKHELLLNILPFIEDTESNKWSFIDAEDGSQHKPNQTEIWDQTMSATIHTKYGSEIHEVQDITQKPNYVFPK